MHVLAADRPEFAPPAPPGRLRAFGLAVLAHALLLAALTWGVSWRSDSTTPAVEAELWSAVPQQAAPKLVEVPAEPEPTPAPPPPKADPGPSAADIALAREKERKAKEKLEQERREKEREKEKLAQQKREQEKKLAEEKKKKELEAQRKDKLKEQEDAKKRELMRQDNLKRMAGLAGLAGATGGAAASGTALRSSGPSASYAGRIVGRVRPNIVFTEDIAGNPSAEVEVRCAPDGTIVGRKLTKSSGSKAWDEAVLKALDKTEVLPRDTDGRVPSALIISFRPRD